MELTASWGGREINLRVSAHSLCLDLVTRAQPLSPAARRQSLKDATRDLLVEHGLQISTRQIATAAGVAEGTIFRAFPTKQDLIAETITDALDAAPMIAEIESLPPGHSLAERITALIALTTDRMQQLRALHPLLQQPQLATAGPQCPVARHRESRTAVNTAIAASLTPYAGELRITPRAAASALSAYSFAFVHFEGDPAGPPADLASLLLHGIAKESAC